MRIKYEAEVKDCSECDLFTEWEHECQFDNQPSGIEPMRKYPCQLRPCPIEVKPSLEKALKEGQEALNNAKAAIAFGELVQDMYREKV